MQGHSQTFTGFYRCHHFDLTEAGAVFAQTLRIRDTSARLNISYAWQLKSSEVQA